MSQKQKILFMGYNKGMKRLLVYEKPIIKKNSKDKFETVLFFPVGENRQGEGHRRELR